MKPKEKAKELFEKMDIDSGSWHMDEVQIKECAKIAVQEIIKALKDNHDNIKCKIRFDYWEEVKDQIDLL